VAICRICPNSATMDVLERPVGEHRSVIYPA
jgi:hypothetical protein